VGSGGQGAFDSDFEDDEFEEREEEDLPACLVLATPEVDHHNRRFDVFITNRNQTSMRSKENLVLPIYPGEFTGFTAAVPLWLSVVVAQVGGCPGDTRSVEEAVKAMATSLRTTKSLGLPTAMNTPLAQGGWGALVTPLGVGGLGM
jgi:hypothetical protein